MKAKSTGTLFMGVSKFKSNGKDLFKVIVADIVIVGNRERITNNVEFLVREDVYKKALAFEKEKDLVDLDLGITLKGFEFKVYLNDMDLAC